MKTEIAGMAKVSESGEVRLPKVVLDELGWKPDDSLLVTVVDGDRPVVSHRSKDIVAHFAGALTHLYPDPEDTRRFFDEGRGYYDESDSIIEP